MCQYENKGYDELKKDYAAGGDAAKNVELLWRLAEACYRKGNDTDNNEARKKLILEEIVASSSRCEEQRRCASELRAVLFGEYKGREYGRKAVEICPDGNLQVLKWAAILVGSSTDYLGTKERIEQAYVLKGLLDKAIKIDPKDSTLLHLRGRYAFGIANLSWLERKAASAFFATPPVATIDEALADFVACHTIRNDFIENNIYAARCYIAKKDIPNAVKFLQEAIALPVSDENEKALVEEAKALLKKHHK